MASAGPAPMPRPERPGRSAGPGNSTRKMGSNERISRAAKTRPAGPISRPPKTRPARPISRPPKTRPAGAFPRPGKRAPLAPFPGLLVLGTDTGVGKTQVTAALVHALRARGLPAVGLKPVETGCGEIPDGTGTLGLPADA